MNSSNVYVNIAFYFVELPEVVLIDIRLAWFSVGFSDVIQKNHWMLWAGRRH